MERTAGRLEGKVCLITGASGIAAESAKLAAREGARVFIASLGEEECRALCAAIEDGGGETAFRQGDLTDASNCEAAVAACVERFGRLDCLFNVAGISGRRYGDAPAHECSDEGWEKTIQTNLGSVFRMCRAALRQMLTQRRQETTFRGAVLNMASVLAFSPQAEFFATHAYAAAKAGIIGLTKAMSAYYSAHGIRVNAIAPGLVRTPMSARVQGDATLREFVRRKQPLAGNLLEASDVAAAAIFLLSDEARMITGDVLVVDGGWSTQ